MTVKHVTLEPWTEPIPRRTGLPRLTLMEQRCDPGVPHGVRLLVRERAGNGRVDQARCEACGRLLGRYGGQVEARLARTDADGADPVIGAIANAVLLCGTRFQHCYGACHARDFDMETRGFWIRDGDGPGHDPRRVPVTVWGPPGRDGPMWLTDRGTYSREPAEVAQPALRLEGTGARNGNGGGSWISKICGSPFSGRSRGPAGRRERTSSRQRLVVTLRASARGWRRWRVPAILS